MPLDTFTLADYERLLIARYVNGGHDRETALHFTRGEIAAIRSGNHWTYGKPTAPDPKRLIIEQLSRTQDFAELAGKYEYDAGMNRSDAEARAAIETLTALGRKAPDPPKPRSIYQGLAALRRMAAAGIGLKDFYAKSKDSDPDSYTADFREITTAWERGARRFKAFVRGRFIVLDVDLKPGKPNGLAILYKLFPPETMPRDFQDIPGGLFPCYVTTPSGGYHLYFRYDGAEMKLRELAPAIEIKEWQITAPGSIKENGFYVLHGDLTNAPPLYGVIIDAIEEAKRKKELAKAEHLQPRARAVADRPVRFERPRITLDDLTSEAASAYVGHHDRQVCFAGKACRCKFSLAETLAYVKSRPDIFGNDADTENTIRSVFRDNGGGV
jgi:hypothetical protein